MPRRHDNSLNARASAADAPRSQTGPSRRSRGASLPEYALLVGLVAAAVLGALRLLGDNTSSSFEHAAAATAGEVAPTPSPSAGGSGGGGSPDGGGAGGGTPDGGGSGGGSAGGPGAPADDPSGAEVGGIGTENPDLGGPNGSGSHGAGSGGDGSGSGAGDGSSTPGGGTTSIEGSGTWLDAIQTRWRASATVVVYDPDGDPLAMPQTQLHYYRIRLVRNGPDAPITEVNDGLQVSNVDPRTGSVVLSGIDVQHGGWYSVEAVRFEVVRVIYNGDGKGTDPSDGHKPSITVVPPAS